MSSEALSEQLFVRDGAGYDEVYLSSQHDPGTSPDERDPSANSPSLKEDKDLDVVRSIGDLSGDLSNGDVYYIDPPSNPP